MKFIKMILTIFVCILFFMTGCENAPDQFSFDTTTPPAFDLTKLETAAGEFQYPDVLWSGSIEETLEKFEGMTFEETEVAQDGERRYYSSIMPVEIDGKNSKIMLEFNNDQLELIRLNFVFAEDKDGSEWFYSQLEKCTEIYGEPADVKNSESPASDKLPSFSTEGYRWTTDHTTLQMILVSGEDARPSVMIGLGLLP